MGLGREDRLIWTLTSSALPRGLLLSAPLAPASHRPFGLPGWSALHGLLPGRPNYIPESSSLLSPPLVILAKRMWQLKSELLSRKPACRPCVYPQNSWRQRKQDRWCQRVTPREGLGFRFQGILLVPGSRSALSSSLLSAQELLVGGMNSSSQAVEGLPCSSGPQPLSLKAPLCGRCCNACNSSWSVTPRSWELRLNGACTMLQRGHLTDVAKIKFRHPPTHTPYTFCRNPVLSK